MDELARIAELLRPLWPGVVFTMDGGRYMVGQAGVIRMAVRAIPTIYQSDVWLVEGRLERRLDRRDWSEPAEAQKCLTEQAQAARQIAHDLYVALGLEVSNG